MLKTARNTAMENTTKVTSTTMIFSINSKRKSVHFECIPLIIPTIEI